MFKNHTMQVKMIKDNQTGGEILNGTFGENNSSVALDVTAVVREVSQEVTTAIVAYMLLDTARKVLIALASK